MHASAKRGIGPRTGGFPTALLALVAICPALEASARDEPAPASIQLLIPADASETEYRSLEQALDAHLGRLALDAQLTPVDEIPVDPREQEEQALRILRDKGDSVVVWIDQPRRTVTLIHLDPADHQSRMERRIDCISQHLGQCSDTIASVLSSAISSWIGPPPAAEEPGQSKVEYAVDNELTPVELTKPPWKKPHPLVRLSLGAGYGAVPFKGTSNAAHGFDVGLWVVVVKHLMFETVFDFLWPLAGHSSEIGGELEIRHWDLAVRLGGALPLGRLVLALTAGAVFDISGVESVSDHVEVEDRNRVRKGFSALLSVRVRLVEWLSLWIAGGVDELDSELVYRGADPDGNEAVMIRCGALQGRFLAGVAIGLGLGSMRED